MGIIQEDRLDAPKPEVRETEYGAQYVNAATESPVTEAADAVADEPLPDTAAADAVDDVQTADTVSNDDNSGDSDVSDAADAAAEAPVRKKRTGRPKKRK